MAQLSILAYRCIFLRRQKIHFLIFISCPVSLDDKQTPLEGYLFLMYIQNQLYDYKTLIK